MIAFRILTVLAAACLVGSFALASLLPPDLPLGQALLAVDKQMFVAAHDAMLRRGAGALWSNVVAPILARPTWVPAAMLGVVLAGLAITVRPRATAAPPRRHRS